MTQQLDPTHASWTPHDPQILDDIATLPPLDEWQPEIPISESTGQPRRGKVMVVGMLFLYAAAVNAAVAYAKVWWDTIHVENWPHSARLLEMVHVRPGSWQSIVWVTVLGLMAAAMVAAPAIAGFNAWNGHRWSRIAACVAIAFAGLGYFSNHLAWVGVPLSIIGAIILFTRPVTRYFNHWAAFREGELLHPTEWGEVVYGPVRRFG